MLEYMHICIWVDKLIVLLYFERYQIAFEIVIILIRSSVIVSKNINFIQIEKKKINK